MTTDTIKEANELIELIQITKSGLSELKLLKLKNRIKDNKIHDDGQFWLSISEHSDGSGNNAKLNRYHGNQELLDIIISTLENQLERFEYQLKQL